MCVKQLRLQSSRDMMVCSTSTLKMRWQVPPEHWYLPNYMVSHPRMLTAIRTFKLACRTVSAMYQLKPPFGVLQRLACREQAIGSLKSLHSAL
jgi:hypothetical protein